MRSYVLDIYPTNDFILTIFGYALGSRLRSLLDFILTLYLFTFLLQHHFTLNERVAEILSFLGYP